MPRAAGRRRSRPFLRSEWAQRLQVGGVALQAALPARLWRLPFVRFDLRLHQKIAVIDGRIAYTGSLNLVDSRFFKQTAGVGRWVDAAVRIEGPAVEPLGITFLGDWRKNASKAFRSCGNRVTSARCPSKVRSPFKSFPPARPMPGPNRTNRDRDDL